MSTTVTQNTTIAISMTTVNPSSCNEEKRYYPFLLANYSVVLLIGTISLSLMIHIMKSSTTSITSIAVLNLIFTHFIFLLTVPFRIYYYAAHSWDLGYASCKLVSSMIHIHMYMSFIFYVIILITRLMPFYRKAQQVASIQKVHALLGSAVVWIVVLVVCPCIIFIHYGQTQEKNNCTECNTTHCFQFGSSITESFKVLNIIISTLIIVVATVLAALQTNVLRVLYRKHREGCTSQQDFGAQLKSLCFALIMVVCFIPYHMFRIYYVTHINELQSLNELLLSLTTFNCLDMLTFLGRRTCSMCLPGKLL